MSEFDDRVDEAVTRALDGEPPDDAYGQPAAAINRVFMESTPRLSPAAKSRHLAQLDARMQKQAQTRARGSARPFGTLLRWAQVAAVSIVVVLAANGISSASASSLPGSPLYPIKRLSEQGNLTLASTPGQRARAWMSLASVRLEEAQQLVANHSNVDADLLSAIEESLLRALLETANTRGSERVTLLEQIAQLAIREQTVLTQLASQVTPSDRAELQETARLLQGVASLANSGQTNPALLTPTAPAAATDTPTLTPSSGQPADPTPTRTNAAPAQPAAAPSLALTPTPADEKSSPEHETTTTPQPSREQQSGGNKIETPEPQKNNTETQGSKTPAGSQTSEHDQPTRNSD